MKSESEVVQLCPTLATPWTVAHQAPPSMEFSRLEYWSGVPLPSPIHAIGECKVLWECRRRRCHIILRKSEKELTFEIGPKGSEDLTINNGEETRDSG